MLNNLSGRSKLIGIEIAFTDSVKKGLSIIGFDPVYGARPLRREIQSKVEDELSEKILEGSIKAGDKVLCDYIDGKCVFTIK